MLIPCPECGVEVSQKAPTCPKCGTIVAHPPFYTLVEEHGLSIESLMWDWLYGPLDNTDDTAFGCGQAIRYLCDNSDDAEMAAATIKVSRELSDAMRNRLMQLSKKSAEAHGLELTMQYVQAARVFAGLVRGCFHAERIWNPTQIQADLEIALNKLEAIKASCKNDKDTKLISAEIEECKKFGAKVLAERSTPSKAIPPVTTPPKSSGCMSLLVVIIVLTAAITYAAVAIGK